MIKLKQYLSFLLGFIVAVLIIAFTLLLIAHTTIFDKEYIKTLLNDNNYYEKISGNIIESIKDYMVSSGLPESILDNIYTDTDVKNDIDTFIDNYYAGKIEKLDTGSIEEKLNNNIDKYLEDHDVKITDQKSLDTFTKEILEIYENKVYLYHNIDNFAHIFNKINTMVNTWLIITGVVLVIGLILVILTKYKYITSIMPASGLMLLFIRFGWYNKVDFNSILIISEDFSKILRLVLNNIGDLMTNSAILIIGIGLVLLVLGFIKNKKE